MNLLRFGMAEKEREFAQVINYNQNELQEQLRQNAALADKVSELDA